MLWDIVPLCEAQLQDVNPNDILEGGLYRKCNTYKGGGGYDKFPEIYNRRYGQKREDLNNQFVVQLQGCPLRCPYCYVTPEGIFGESVKVDTSNLMKSYRDSGCSVLHLMGGAPALHIKGWPDLLSRLEEDEVFHSDLLCLEGDYDAQLLKDIASYPNSLYAVSIKGSTPEEFKANTGVELNTKMFERNLSLLFETGVPCYFTFTGMSKESVARFKKEHSSYSFEDSFAIQLVHYNALDYKKESE